MITHRFLSASAAALITSAQWAVFFYPNLHVDLSRLAAAAVVAQTNANAAGVTGHLPTEGSPNAFLPGGSFDS